MDALPDSFILDEAGNCFGKKEVWHFYQGKAFGSDVARRAAREPGRESCAQPGLCGGDFCPFVAAGVAEIAEAAFFHGAVRQLQGDLRRPAGLGLGHAVHHAHDAGKFVDHDFAEKAFAGGGIFDFGHASSVREKPGAFNV